MKSNPILQIEHPVRDFESWKKAFDSDPVGSGREKSGVLSYRIFRPKDDPKYIAVDLEFGSMSDAEAFLVGLRKLWSRVQAEGLIGNPKARIVHAVEGKEY